MRTFLAGKDATTMPLDWSHPEFRFRSVREWEQLGTDSAYIQMVCRETATSSTLSIVGQQVAATEQENAGVQPVRRDGHVLRTGAPLDVPRSGERVRRQVP
jgi:hypothetical protein